MCELINWSMVVSLPETTPIKKTDSLRSHQLSIASWLELGPSEHPLYFMMGLWLPLYCAGLVQATIVAMSSECHYPGVSRKRCCTLVLPDFFLALNDLFVPRGRSDVQCLFVDKHSTSKRRVESSSSQPS